MIGGLAIQRRLDAAARLTWRRIHLEAPTGFRLREDTFTDTNLLSLTACSAVKIVRVNQVHEARLGADFQWWLHLPAGGYIPMWFQAKRIGVRAPRRGLQQTVGRSSQRQIDTLISQAHRKRALPYYCFYWAWPYSTIPKSKEIRVLASHARVCPKPDQTYGCSVVPAIQVRALLDTVGPGSLQWNDLAALSVPWSCLWSHIPLGGSSADVAARLARAALGSAADPSQGIAKNESANDYLHESLPAGLAAAFEMSSLGHSGEPFKIQTVEGLPSRQVLMELAALGR